MVTVLSVPATHTACYSHRPSAAPALTAARLAPGAGTRYILGRSGRPALGYCGDRCLGSPSRVVRHDHRVRAGLDGCLNDSIDALETIGNPSGVPGTVHLRHRKFGRLQFVARTRVRVVAVSRHHTFSYVRGHHPDFSKCSNIAVGTFQGAISECSNRLRTIGWDSVIRNGLRLSDVTWMCAYD